MNQLFESFTKKFRSEVNLLSDIENILKNYKNLSIAIRHSDSFLKDESKIKHDELLKLLEKHGTVKQTGKIKKI